MLFTSQKVNLLLELVLGMLDLHVLFLDLLNIIAVVVVNFIASGLLFSDLLLKSREKHTLDFDLVHVSLDDLSDEELAITYLATLPPVSFFLVGNWIRSLLYNAHLALRISAEIAK